MIFEITTYRYDPAREQFSDPKQTWLNHVSVDFVYPFREGCLMVMVNSTRFYVKQEDWDSAFRKLKVKGVGL